VAARTKKYILKMYVMGQSSYTQVLIKELKNIFPPDFTDYEIKIIDVLKNPDLAEEDRILATPTVIKEYPLPVRKVMGDLSDKEKVLVGLGLFFDGPEGGQEAR